MTNSSSPRLLSRYWLLLGTSALAIAGLLSLVLVVARTPSLATLPLFDALFHKSLVVHVDLSVLVWFLSIACLMWSLLAAGSRQVFPYLEEAALLCFAIGTLAIFGSVFDPNGEPLMSNYIPVITSPLFFFGLSLLLCGAGLMLVRILPLPLAGEGWGGGTFFASKAPSLTLPPSGRGDILDFAIYSGALIALIAIMAFIWSHHVMPPVIEGQQYYEISFWGGGHVLQFLHTQVLMVCWMLLMGALCNHFNPPKKLLYVLFSIGLLSAFAAPVAYIFYDITSMEYREFFTHLMIGANGIAPALFGLMLLPGLWKIRTNKNALWSSLVMSVFLFLYGGVLAEMIRGQNVTIPAHYHGSIVGITLAFMGAAYLLLPQFGWRNVSGWKLAYWQPFVYGGGQMMHITGLAVSGGYGVLRKTPGAINEISTGVKVAMGFMGLGGLFAIIGGFMFVIVIGKSVLARRA